MRVTAVTGDTLLKLIGGQVRHQLSEYSLADIHPLIVGKRDPGIRAGRFGRNTASDISNRKIQNFL